MSTQLVTRPALPARPVRLATAVLAVVAGCADLVVTAAHGGPMHLAGVSGHLVRRVLGGQYALPAVAVTLIWVSRGLYRAKRNAWLVAVVAAPISIVATHAHAQNLVGALPSAVLLGTLVVGRPAFRARHDPARPRDALRVLAVGALAVFVYGFVGLLLLDSQFTASIGVVAATFDTVRSMVLLAPGQVDAVTHHGLWLLESIRVASLIVVFTAAARLILTYLRPVPLTERRTVDQLVQDWGDTSLAPFQVGIDKSFFLSADGSTFIAYRLVNGVAVALGGPVGPPEGHAATMGEFSSWCEINGWLPAFHQLTAGGADDARRSGLAVLKVGEEAVVELASWSLDLPEHKSLRSALRRVERAGFAVVELPTPIDDATMGQLRAVSDSWLAGGHRERTFTVGRFDEEHLRTATVLAVRHHDTGRIVAFVDVLDPYRSTSGNFDLMRRDPAAPNGVMDALMVALIERFRVEGLSGLTLGLAPMANISGNRVRERAMRLAYERGEALFNYQGLRHFKDKWRPLWQPRYVAFTSDAALPKVALAIVRASEIAHPGARFGRARRVVTRLPATLCLGGLVIWFMAATNGSPSLHHELLRHIGLSWRDLTHLQLWRLPTSQLAETTAGFVWSNVALLMLILPIAEWRLGTRRTVLVFFLGDWASTLITLVALRFVSPWSSWAAHILVVRDAGPSAGAWALVITVALTLRPARVRRVLTTALMTFLVATMILHGRLYDVQHLLSACAAAAGVALVNARRNRRKDTTARRPPPTTTSRSARRRKQLRSDRDTRNDVRAHAGRDDHPRAPARRRRLDRLTHGDRGAVEVRASGGGPIGPAESGDVLPRRRRPRARGLRRDVAARRAATRAAQQEHEPVPVATQPALRAAGQRLLDHAGRLRVRPRDGRRRARPGRAVLRDGPLVGRVLHRARRCHLDRRRMAPDRRAPWARRSLDQPHHRRRRVVRGLLRRVRRRPGDPRALATHRLARRLRADVGRVARRRTHLHRSGPCLRGAPRPRPLAGADPRRVGARPRRTTMVEPTGAGVRSTRHRSRQRSPSEVERGGQHGGELQGAVADERLRARGATGEREAHVPAHADEDGGEDRQGPRRLEVRPAAADRGPTGDGGAECDGGDGEQRSGERVAVERQRTSVLRRGTTELAALAAPFPGGDHGCAGRHCCEEPGRDRCVGRGAAEEDTEHESGGDRQDVDDGDPLEACAVGDGEERVGSEPGGGDRSEQQAGRRCGEEQHGTDGQCVRRCDLAGGDGSAPLDRVQTIAGCVERVVDQIGAACGAAGERRGGADADDRADVQLDGDERCGEDECRLRPLRWADGADPSIRDGCGLRRRRIAGERRRGDRRWSGGHVGDGTGAAVVGPLAAGQRKVS